jgi:PPK2 family polyphosphate:nucleotide phosphotransferase
MPRAAKSPYLVPFDASFRVAKAPTGPPDGAPSPKRCRSLLSEAIEELRELQERLNAEDRRALLIVFQAMDAAGKDGTIRAVMTGINPAGVEVYSFKQPNSYELDHDFLWRTAVRLPERGHIGIFNRSYYEEVLVVRVHPEFLDAQGLTHRPPLKRLWEERYESIREHEKHLARNGTTILKFWLNVSKEEQRRRFLSRIEEAEKNWKFQAADIRERQHWKQYMVSYQEALNATSRPWAPWYVIPADDKDYMRMLVAEIVVKTLRRLDPQYPKLPREAREELAKMQKRLRKGEA